MENYEPLEDSDEEVRQLAQLKVESERNQLIIKDEVSCVLPTEKNLYLSLTRFLLQEGIEVMFRNKILDLQEDKLHPEELLRKMIDNMCLNGLCLVPKGIVAIVSKSPKNHRKTLCCGVNGNLYFYRTDLPFQTQELEKEKELLVGNFDYVIIEQLTFTKKQKIKNLPRKYKVYQTELKKPFIGTNNDLFSAFIPHSKFRRFEGDFLTQKEMIVKYKRTRATKNKYRLFGENITLSPYVYQASSKECIHEFEDLISYEFTIKSLLFMQIEDHTFSAEEDVYVVGLTGDILVNDKHITENTCIRINTSKIKISAEKVNVCLFTIQNPPSQ